MKVLLDTHSFLWFIGGSSRLSVAARAQIEEVRNTRYLSLASIWEIATKTNLGKLTLDVPFTEFLPQQLILSVTDILPITFEHTLIVASMPHYHRDPFDRMLIAQALVEDLAIVSADPLFNSYGVQRVW